MSNFKKDLLEALNGEEVLAVRINSYIEYWYAGRDVDDSRDQAVTPYLNQIISWEVAAPLFDYEYDAGYGGQDCHDIYIWTKDSVLYIHEYDGSTTPTMIPRNPI